MDFVQANRICLTQKYFTFHGRARRSEYWWFFLALVGVTQSLSTFAALDPEAAQLHEDLWIYLEPMQPLRDIFNGLQAGGMASVSFAAMLFFTIPDWAAKSRRFQDVGVSGLWAIPVVLAPFLHYGGTALFLIALIWLARPGQEGENRYGPDPMAEERAAEAAARQDPGW